MYILVASIQFLKKASGMPDELMLQVTRPLSHRLLQSTLHVNVECRGAAMLAAFGLVPEESVSATRMSGIQIVRPRSFAFGNRHEFDEMTVRLFLPPPPLVRQSAMGSRSLPTEMFVARRVAQFWLEDERGARNPP